MPITTDHQRLAKHLREIGEHAINLSANARVYCMQAADVLAALPAQAVDGWQDIASAPNDSDFRWYGLHCQTNSGYEWFEAHYLSHDDDGEMMQPCGDTFTDWAFSDFAFWCAAPAPPPIMPKINKPQEIKMLASLKRKWIKALRSGRYKQGNGDLYAAGAYCCLGVLAKVQGAVARENCLKIKGQDVRRGASTGDQTEYLAKPYSAGLHTKTQNRLANMNDGRNTYVGDRKSFKQIAEFIEKNL